MEIESKQVSVDTIRMVLGGVNESRRLEHNLKKVKKKKKGDIQKCLLRCKITRTVDPMWELW